MNRCLSALSVFGVLAMCTPATAQTQAADEWRVTFAPYMMGASMNGTSGIAGQEVAIDASASDVFSNLQFGAMGMFAAKKGDWGLGGDFIWMALGAVSDQPPANVDVNQGAFAFYGLRRLSPVADLTFGVRWNLLQPSIGFKGPLGTVVEETKQWVDPIVGLHLRTQGQGRVHAGLYSEIGGFGVGSKFAWQIFPTVGVDIGRRAAIDFGYRWLDMNYESGDGLTFFKYDVLTQGPAIGFVFKF